MSNSQQNHIFGKVLCSMTEEIVEEGYVAHSSCEMIFTERTNMTNVWLSVAVVSVLSVSTFGWCLSRKRRRTDSYDELDVTHGHGYDGHVGVVEVEHVDINFVCCTHPCCCTNRRRAEECDENSLSSLSSGRSDKANNSASVENDECSQVPVRAKHTPSEASV